LRKKLGISDTTFLIGFLGRFMPQKGFEYLIEAMDMLVKRHHGSLDIRVLAVGSGDYLEAYKKRVAGKGLANRFVFVPFQPDVAPVYDAADVIVMPSVWEAFGLQAAEALCMGRPIIASDCIGLREAIKDTPAIVVPTGNAAAIADSVSRLILEPPSLLFHDFREEARKRFDVRKTSSELQTLLISLVSGQT
jgi:glycosyltransferase involved in cell wall biosynthesis